MTAEPGNHHPAENKHPYRSYWLTGGLVGVLAVLATIIAAVITLSGAHSSGGSTVSSAGSGGSSADPGQPGYISLWHKSITFGDTGVIFQLNDPVTKNNDSWDIAYGQAWGVSSFTALNLWLSRNAPTPADCASESNKSITADDYGTGYDTVAQVGNRYCFGKASLNGLIIVVSLTVTNVHQEIGDNSVTLDAWAWAPRS